MLALGAVARARVRRRVRHPATRRRRRRVLDPSGVVKGWAVERAAAALRELPDTDFCLSAGGDMVCRTADAGRRAVADRDRGPATTRAASSPSSRCATAPSPPPARPTAVSTWSTPAPASRRRGVASVTVVADSLTWADIDATAAYAHGPDAARWLGTRRGRTGLVVWADGTTTTVEPVFA